MGTFLYFWFVFFVYNQKDTASSCESRKCSCQPRCKRHRCELKKLQAQKLHQYIKRCTQILTHSCSIDKCVYEASDSRTCPLSLKKQAKFQSSSLASLAFTYAATCLLPHMSIINAEKICIT